jgi:hypothetical protein
MGMMIAMTCVSALDWVVSALSCHNPLLLHLALHDTQSSAPQGFIEEFDGHQVYHALRNAAKSRSKTLMTI